MAPNNALRKPDDKKSNSTSPSITNSSEVAAAATTATAMNETTSGRSSTTVLEKGTVENRGMGIRNTNSSSKSTSRDAILDEIHAFVQGEARWSVHAELRAFFTVWTFLTRLPGPIWVDHHPGYLMRGMTYFPLIGSIVIGGFTGAFYDVMTMTITNTVTDTESTITSIGLPSSIAASVSIAASLWLTGCFHEDGLADASDGIGGGWSRTQILRIMSDTRLGTYGCAVLTLYLLTKWQLLTALGPSVWNWHPIFLSTVSSSSSSSTIDSSNTFTEYACRGAAPALLVSHAMSRLTAPYLIRTNDYVDEGGPKYAFYQFMLHAKYLVTWWRVGFAVLTCLILGYIVVGLVPTILLLFAMWIVAHVAGRYAVYLLGGVMGDYLGATICISEIVALILLLLFQNMTDNNMPLTLDWIWNSWNLNSFIWTNSNVYTWIRFCTIVLATYLWSRFVGPPDVFIRESAIANTSRDDGEVHIGLPKNTTTDTKVMTESRNKAQTVCQNDASTFPGRYFALQKYLDSLAKAMGSLGTLEEWAARLGALQRTTRPVINQAACLIFASDHGIAKSHHEGGEGCSAYPQAVTQSVLKALNQGTAGASVLARANNILLKVIDVGVVNNIATASDENSVVVKSSFRLENGTRNCCSEAAMTCEEMEKLLRVGRKALEDCIQQTNANVISLGEVGIGNTTTSSILLAAFTDLPPEQLVSGGATVTREADPNHVRKKIIIVRKALSATHSLETDYNVASILARFGGAEIVAMVGAILQASEQSIPILVDGFIVTVAALAASLLSPNCIRVLFLATQSVECGQSIAIQRIHDLAKQNGIPFSPLPALNMQLRMGEATGALLAVPILRSACAIISDMATLEEILTDECN
jgi:nicotinate-nucleotide--dimethylbenzimidazole phosphoribosyltransferase